MPFAVARILGIILCVVSLLALAQQPALRGTARLIDLPKMGDRELRELIGGIAARFELEHGYAPLAPAAAKDLAPAPQRVTSVGQPIARVVDKRTRVMRMGFVRQPGQLPQLWIHGYESTPGGAAANPDLEELDGVLTAILESRNKNESQIGLAELETRVIKLSYVDADGAMALLKAMGFNAFIPEPKPVAPGTMSISLPGTPEPAPGTPGAPADPSQPQPESAAEVPALPKTVTSDQLPMILKIPGPAALYSGLVGGGEAVTRDALGLTVMLGAASRLAPDTVASPPAQIMVMYNPAAPEQFARVRKVITEYIDRPARQILVEGMVLEVSKDGLDELGVRWEFQQGESTLTLGSLRQGASNTALEFVKDTTRDLAGQLILRIQALERDGKAEVLARPSVLTLDNRQATIRVGTDIPIATSKDASSATEARVAFSFQYLPTGIQLNVRPRLDEGGSEVSMLIDATVSATVPGRDLELRNSTGTQVLASAPTIATRRVQTYARIPDHTPLIIGGLISRDDQDRYDKVPGLGDIPLLGALFRSQSRSSAKREVIIVLTPHVLPEGRSNFARALPKDDASFDSTGNELFRDTYRLRAGDVFDTGYIRSNFRLVTYRDLARRVADRNPAAVERRPLSLLRAGRVPGEESLMHGMMYNTLRRNNIGGDIVANRMIVFEGDEGAGEFRVRRLDSLLAAHGDGKDYRSFFTRNPNKALAIVFRSQRAGSAAGDILEEPKPEVSVVDCPERDACAQRMWELGRDTGSGPRRYPILIHEEGDIARLSRAIVLKRLILVNGGESAVTIDNFLVGRQISIPEIGRTQTHLVDADVAKLYFHSIHHYNAFEEDFERAMASIDRELRSPEFRDFIREDEIPRSVRGPARQN